jgi:hypothetical protein
MPKSAATLLPQNTKNHTKQCWRSVSCRVWTFSRGTGIFATRSGTGSDLDNCTLLFQPASGNTVNLIYGWGKNKGKYCLMKIRSDRSLRYKFAGKLCIFGAESVAADLERSDPRIQSRIRSRRSEKIGSAKTNRNGRQ